MIKDDLQRKDFIIIEAVNKIKNTVENGKVKVTPLPLFMLTFDNSEDIKRNYEIRHICSLAVRIRSLEN